MQNNSTYIIIDDGLIHTVDLKIVNIGVYNEGPYCYYFQSDHVITSWKGKGWDTKNGTQYFLGGNKKMAIEWMNIIQARLKN
jgi:hypothetical protein